MSSGDVVPAGERKLAAILAAHVVGSSRLMEADEEGTVARLTAYRTVIGSLVEAHRGRHDTDLDPLRDHPRFESLFSRPKEQSAHDSAAEPNPGS